MKHLSAILTALGIVGLLASINIDTSVQTIVGPINNIGLLSHKQNFIIISSALLICGVLLYIGGVRSDNKTDHSSNVRFDGEEAGDNDLVNTKRNGNLELFFLVLGIIFIGWMVFMASRTKPNDTAVTKTSQRDKTTPPSSDDGWTYNVTADSMTDERIVAVSGTVFQDNKSYLVDISCRSDHIIRYSIMIKNESGIIEPIRVNLAQDASGQWVNQPIFYLRSDSGDPIRLLADGTSYPNEVVFSGDVNGDSYQPEGGLAAGDIARIAINSHLLTFKFLLLFGESYLKVDQDAPSLRHFFEENCRIRTGSTETPEIANAVVF
jgi:hypothetical protein